MEPFLVMLVMNQWTKVKMALEQEQEVLQQVDNQEWEDLDNTILILKLFNRFKHLFKTHHSQ